VYGQLGRRITLLGWVALLLWGIAHLLGRNLWSRLGMVLVATIFGGFFVLKILEWLGWLILPPQTSRPLSRASAASGELLGALIAWPSRILPTAPLFGPLLLWQAIAEWARLVALLLEARVPLPDAIELASQGVRSASIARAMHPIAQGVRQGHGLAMLIEHSFWLPASLGPLVAWGQKTGQLSEALRTAAEMFDGRVRLRATLLKQIVPPIMFLLVAACLGIVVTALFSPLIKMIQMLS
jgi:hypothetical protein